MSLLLFVIYKAITNTPNKKLYLNIKILLLSTIIFNTFIDYIFWGGY